MSTPLAIVGTGKMGSLVEQLAPEHGFEVRARFDVANIAALSRESLNGAAIAIEFTAPGAAPENLRRLAALGVNTVCGTTGWYDHLPEVRNAVARAGAHTGTHEIGFDSPADTITLRHTARSREGFAHGALLAARWIAGKKGVFEFREILNELGRSGGASAAP